MAPRLSEFKEAVGVLIEIEEFESFAVATFSWGAISLPIELSEKLREMQGKKIGILRLNGYHIHCLDGEMHG